MPNTTPDMLDWSQIREDIHCPLCEYNLRGLVEPRCPECGYRFEWKALLDPVRRLHPYLFEHHPERNAWSFVKTQLGGFATTEFWRRLHPAQRSRPRRLMLYCFLCIAPIVLLLAALLAGDMDEMSRAYRATRSGLIARAVAQGRTTASIQPYLDSVLPLPPSRAFFNMYMRQLLSSRNVQTLKGEVFATLLLLVWPWATFLTLMIFRISMRRASVRTVHVVRCIVYSADFFWMIVVAIALILLVPQAVSVPGPARPGNFVLRVFSSPLLYISPLVCVPVFVYRLTMAYRQYLQFDHPTATILSTQVILGLAACIALIFITTP